MRTDAPSRDCGLDEQTGGLRHHHWPRHHRLLSGTSIWNKIEYLIDAVLTTTGQIVLAEPDDRR